MKYLRTFAFSIGKRYQELAPDPEMISPDKTETVGGYEGCAYSARTPEKDIVPAYFEKGCVTSQVRGLRRMSTYRAQWFDPRHGTWLDAGNGWLQSSFSGVIELPAFPGDIDWGLRLIHAGPVSSVRRSNADEQ